jgi:hypothetical protein
MLAPPEHLGSFFIGAEHDPQSGQRDSAAFGFNARDLTTHAICVGMTGSGKTGLCVTLLEEAAIDGVPALIIDPKGEMADLLLQFPELRATDFEPWINPDDARRHGQTLPEYAKLTAESWRDGLADWGIGPARIRLLGQSADFSVYTPGSSAGLSINILGSLSAPALDFDAHAETLRERISGTVSALLGLLGIPADPIRSREAILLATIFEHFWRHQQDVDLSALIQAIQDPPVRQMGALDVDTFFPPKERFALAMSFNNLIAAPSFQTWLSGESLDTEQLLFTGDGKPRHSIFYLAHLSDNERMFFVTLLLENVITWMRRQTGTTSLRALLYFDEIFGFFPSRSEPPSKRPLLTLLKQARAFGLGCILGAQNPIDIDYKGLTNAGIWFLGRLQAERDQERVLHGLRGAIAEARGAGEHVDYETLLSSLQNRTFLVHNIHQDRPNVIQTRWAMSYLRGPLTKLEIQRLMAERKATAQAMMPAFSPQRSQPSLVEQPLASGADVPAGFWETPPVLEPTVTQVYLPVELAEDQAIRQLSKGVGLSDVERVNLVYEPALLGGAYVRFVDRRRRINEQRDKVLLALIPDHLGGVDWETAEALPLSLDDALSTRPPQRLDHGPYFAPVPDSVQNERDLKSIGRSLADWLYYQARLTIMVHSELEIYQQPGERERSFKARLRQLARERRDDELAELEDKFEERLDRLEARLRKEHRGLVSDQAEFNARKREERIATGETVLSFFLGRRRTRGISTIASKQRLSDKARMDIEESQQEIAEIEEGIAALEADLEEVARAISHKWSDLLDDVSTEEIHPRRSDVDVRLVALAWVPSWHIRYGDRTGTRTTTIRAFPAGE